MNAVREEGAIKSDHELNAKFVMDPESMCNEGEKGRRVLNEDTSTLGFPRAEIPLLRPCASTAASVEEEREAEILQGGSIAFECTACCAFYDWPHLGKRQMCDNTMTYELACKL